MDFHLYRIQLKLLPRNLDISFAQNAFLHQKFSLSTSGLKYNLQLNIALTYGELAAPKSTLNLLDGIQEQRIRLTESFLLPLSHSYKVLDFYLPYCYFNGNHSCKIGNLVLPLAVIGRSTRSFAKAPFHGWDQNWNNNNNLLNPRDDTNGIGYVTNNDIIIYILELKISDSSSDSEIQK